MGQSNDSFCSMAKWGYLRQFEPCAPRHGGSWAWRFNFIRCAEIGLKAERLDDRWPLYHFPLRLQCVADVISLEQTRATVVRNALSLRWLLIPARLASTD